MSDELKPITAADTGFDADEPNARGILIFTSATIILFIAVLVGVTFYYKHVADQEEYEMVLSAPSQQLADLHSREDRELKNYSYVDKAKGQVRLPIDRAMDLIAKEAAEGKLKYPQADQAKKVEPAAGAPGAVPTGGAAAPASAPAPAAAGK